LFSSQALAAEFALVLAKAAALRERIEIPSEITWKEDLIYAVKLEIRDGLEDS
jgi:hypothetical protein